MKTKFAPIVKFKKSELDKAEERVQNSLRALHLAKQELQSAYAALLEIPSPTSGTIEIYQANKLLLQRQREIIKEATQRVASLQEQLHVAQQEQKEAYIELEKYSYLESEEIKKMLKEREKAEAKALDEVALQSFMNRRLSS